MAVKKKTATRGKSALTAPPRASKVPRGARESAEWLARLGISPTKPKWYAEAYLDVVDGPASQVYMGTTDSRFHLRVYADEWGLLFIHKGKTSHIRRTDHDFINGEDGHALLKKMPDLADVATFIARLEKKHGLSFHREHAWLRTNLPGGKQALREWLLSTAPSRA
jgi:hypothetical protein